MTDRLMPCDECHTPTDIDLLDGKPNARAMAAFGSLVNCADHGVDFDRLLCRGCYGPGWNPATEAARHG